MTANKKMALDAIHDAEFDEDSAAKYREIATTLLEIAFTAETRARCSRRRAAELLGVEPSRQDVDPDEGPGGGT